MSITCPPSPPQQDESVESPPPQPTAGPSVTRSPHTNPRSSLRPRYRKVATLVAHTKGVSCLRYSPCGRFLASAGADGIAHLWNAESGQHLRSYKGHTRGINDMAISPDGLYLATVADEGQVIVWSIQKSTPLRRLASHTSHVLCVTFNPKANVLVTGGWDESVIFWNVRLGQPMRTLQAHSDPVTSVAYNPDGTMIVTGGYDGLMRIWDGQTGQCLKTIENDEQNSPVSYVSFTPNGDNLISSSLSSCIRIWNYHTSRCIKSYTGHTSTKYNCPAIVVDPLAISPKQRNTTERQRLAQGDSSGLTMSNAGSTAVESVPQAWIVSGSDTNQVYIWDGQSKTLLQTLEEHSDTVVAVAAHPSSRMIATGALERDKTIILWRDEGNVSNLALDKTSHVIGGASADDEPQV